MKLLLKIYKSSLSPIVEFLFPGGGCRFKPTCSEYSVEVIEKHGIIRGGLLAIKRVLKCNAWSKS